MAPTLQLNGSSPHHADDEQLGAAASAATNGHVHLPAIRIGKELGMADAGGILRRGPSAKHHILHSDSPFWLLDVGRTQQLMAEWTAAFPRVRPFYAVKCNNHPLFLRTLASAQAGFDCAIKEELQQITLLGVSSERIVFANPYKLQSHMEFATVAGVQLTTFDSAAELHKIKKSMAWDKAKLLLRIETNDEGATISVSSKYGAHMEEVPVLLRSAREAGLAVVGVALHVGSRATNPNAFEEANIANARSVFEVGEELNEGSTGGGISSRDVAPMINKALDGYFPDPSCTNTAAMDGCNSNDETPFTLVARIFGKFVRGTRREYWINDGAHHSFPMIVTPQHARAAARPLRLRIQALQHELSGLPLFPSNVFGPTYSALDTLLKGHPLPELEIGDLLAFPFMGAYTNSLATSFNGFGVSHIPAFGFVVAD
ncbi:hypothetical protein GOP47_0013182 [Adiantum capillus-veneris]|uniref:Ornithine decarboxylase n=1 Tax=Adiantum capillus-veneris TaxID=13818 RepID=A0A9D4ZFJ4_ADICA|nr:hypothetical protein GOP47_0013182 [Adiantum capillus-veneris]